MNSFKASLANEACTPCGDYGVTYPALQIYAEFLGPKTTIEDCVCPAGQTFDDGQSACVDCTAGKFKSGLGDTACPDCPTGYSTATGGQTSCVCDRGYGSESPDPLNCVICQTGKVSNEISTAACSECPQNQYQLGTGETLCDPCPGDSSTNGATGQSVCTCNLGYQIDTSDYARCDPCRLDDRNSNPPVDGTYKDQLTPDRCEDCQAGCLANHRVISFCDTENDLNCEACQADSNSPANNYLSDCNCNAGYEFDSGARRCEECAAGKYKVTNSNNLIPCQDCTEGTNYAENPGSASCTSCSTECENNEFIEVTCKKHADIECKSCTSCPAGEYRTGSCEKTGTSDYRCETCTAGRYCPGGDIQDEQPCPGGATSPAGSSSVEDCGCAAGQYDNAGTCEECPADSWCIHDERNLCEDSVNPNPDEDTDSDSVFSDPGSSDVTACRCQPGYYKVDTADGHTCNKCPGSTYCPGFNQAIPTVCPDLIVPYVMISPPGSDELSDCICGEGSYNKFDGTECIQCDANTFCTGDGFFRDCTNFRPNSWTQDVSGRTSQTFCVCQPKYYLNDQNVCAPCEAGNYCEGTGASPQSCPSGSTSDPSSDDLFDCRCEAGYEREEDSDAGTLNCRPCDVGEFCDGGVAGTCNANSHTPELAQFAHECVCNDGFKTDGRDAEDRVECLECAAGTYCSAGVEYQCSDVGAHLSTETSRNNEIEDCKCKPGYYTVSELDGNGDYAPVCAACDGDSFCPGYGTASNAKSSCPPNSLAEAPADELSDCECVQMFYKSISTGSLFTCESCDSGFYCPLRSEAPVACPSANMHSDEPRLDITHCQCDDGYHNNNAVTDDSTVCLECPIDHYCSGNGLTSCNDPSTPNTHTNGATGQSLVGHCICQPGFGIFSNGGTCSRCQANYYCPGDGTTGDPLTHENAQLCDEVGECLQTHSCDSSSPHTRVSNPGASSFSDCECIAGFAHTLDGQGNVIPECAECVYSSPNGGTWKKEIGNYGCNDCNECIDEGEYYTAECQTTSDTACTSCPTCSHSCTPPSEGEPGSVDYPHCDTNFVQRPCSGSDAGQCTSCRKCETSPLCRPRRCGSNQYKY